MTFLQMQTPPEPLLAYTADWQVALSFDGVHFAAEGLLMLHTLPMVHISQVANIIRTDELTPDQKAVLSALALTTDMPKVTTSGEAWGNTNQSGTQDTAVSAEIVFDPDFMYYNIYTQDDIDIIRTNGVSEVQSHATSMFLSQGGTLPEAGTPAEDIDTILEVGDKCNDVLVVEALKN